MKTIKASDARDELGRLIDEVAVSRQPLRISGKRNKAILVSEQDWAAIQETLFHLSVPGMRASIQEGLETPISKCRKDLRW